jgi:type VI secretion system protein ImpL
MKLLAISRIFKKRLLATLSSNELYLNALKSLSILAGIAGLIWFIGPYLSYHDYAPFAQTEKRLYAILIIFLCWTLKFVLLDLSFPNVWHHKDPEVRIRLQALIKRFRGAMQFMKSTTIIHQDKPLHLQELPWFLMIGPSNAGKTALLAHSRVPFILQRHFTPALPEHFKPTENCDWWLTRVGGIIDIPGKYIFNSNDAKSNKKNMQQLLWKFFLALLGKQGRKHHIAGIAIALPLAEIMKQEDPEALSNLINTLSSHLRDVENALHAELPCYLILTKCDLIKGFNEFFAESAEDELNQAWGITLPHATSAEDLEQHFNARFNALIKKLNEQLLWRLHHERNPMARPYIKDFPLQIEKLKSFSMEFIKQLNTGDKHCSIQGIYLTSALQMKIEPETNAIDDLINDEVRSIKLFQGPTVKSRAYFIRQLISDSLFPTKETTKIIKQHHTWKQYIAYAASAIAVMTAAIILGQDFRTGMTQTHQVQHVVIDYRNTLQHFNNPNESMTKTLALLNTLQASIKATEQKNTFARILTYYSDKSQKNATIVYQHALQAFLMPEIRNYFGDFLKNPINKDTDTVYNVLKAYLMIGDEARFDANYVRATLVGILPETFSSTPTLLHHYDIAVNSFQPLQLDKILVGDTRKYLFSLRGIQLGYIILKTLDSNIQNSGVFPGDNVQTSTLFNIGTNSKQIPIMFTGKNFMVVFENEIRLAAQEAANGNWILGTDYHPSANPTYAAELTEELRTEYVKNYVDAWETAIASIQLEKPHDLQQADAIISSFTSYDSPLLKLLDIIRDNTYFAPVTTASVKLQTIGQLVDKNNLSKVEIYQLLTNLQALHDYLQPVLSADDPRKAAYDLISSRMQHQGEPDPITKLRMAADQSPMPLKGWINQLSNDTWHFLLKSAMRYMDTSWSESVVKPFRNEMANRYPFANNAVDEVALNKFIRFFGKPGVITSYYTSYLLPFVDTSKPEWTWKTLDGEALPFAPDVPHQLQQAMNIHHAFFPNDDDKLYVPFALQQYKISQNIDSIKLNINDKIIIDKPKLAKSPYVLAWPNNLTGKSSSLEVTMAGQKPVQTAFLGSWGWFKLVNQAYESAHSKNDIILNFSKNSSPAQYLLSTQGKHNPFTALNLNQFTLDNRLTTVG